MHKPPDMVAVVLVVVVVALALLAVVLAAEVVRWWSAHMVAEETTAVEVVRWSSATNTVAKEVFGLHRVHPKSRLRLQHGSIGAAAVVVGVA
jgi:uncharacterized membrane protein